MTPLDRISMKSLLNTAEKLQNGSSKFLPARRVWIPKPGVKELRP